MAGDEIEGKAHQVRGLRRPFDAAVVADERVREGSPDRGIIKNARLIGIVEFGSTYGSNGLLSRKLYISHASTACMLRWLFTTSMSNMVVASFFRDRRGTCTRAAG